MYIVQRQSISSLLILIKKNMKKKACLNNKLLKMYVIALGKIKKCVSGNGSEIFGRVGMHNFF